MSIDLSNVSAAELKAALKEKETKTEKDREAYKELTQEVLQQNLGKLINLSDQISEVKTEVFKNFSEVVQLKTQLYSVKAAQQSHTFTNIENEGLTIGYRVIDGWDDTVNEGIAKVNQFLASLAKDESSASLVKAVNRLLKKDSKGNLKANRVVELENLEEDFNSELFSDGVKIIRKSYKPQRSCYFIDAFTVDSTGKKQTIPLSISSANFTGGYEFKIQDSNS